MCVCVCVREREREREGGGDDTTSDEQIIINILAKLTDISTEERS